MKRTCKRISFLLFGVSLGMAAAVGAGVCATVAGFSQYVGGAARDIGDAAEGTREEMHRGGRYRD